jgi:hypothetical protein
MRIWDLEPGKNLVINLVSKQVNLVKPGKNLVSFLASQETWECTTPEVRAGDNVCAGGEVGTLSHPTTLGGFEC